MVEVVLAVSFVEGGRGLATLLVFLYVMAEVARKYVREMLWQLAAECKMITTKQKASLGFWLGLAATV
jgi:hypothetical protein